MPKQIIKTNKIIKNLKVDLWNNISLKLLNNLFDYKQNHFSIKQNIIITRIKISNITLNLIKKYKLTLLKWQSIWDFVYIISYSKKLKRNKNYFFNFKKKKKDLSSSNKTNYGILLNNRQKLRKFYSNIKLKQFKRYSKKMKLSKESKLKSFVYNLENRIDIILYRLNLLNSLVEAKQRLSHGFFKVNNKLIKKPSFQVSFNDIITLSAKYKSLSIETLKNNLNSKKCFPIPAYYETNFKTFEFKTLKNIRIEEIYYPFLNNKTKAKILENIINF